MNLKLNFIFIVGVVLFSDNLKTTAQAPQWEWVNVVSGKESDGCRSITLDPGGNGDVYVTGFFSETRDFDPGPDSFKLTSSGRGDIFISKFNSSGNFVWTKAMGGPTADVATSIIVDPAGSGEIYTTGIFHETVDFDCGEEIFNLTSAGSTDIFIQKLDASGNFVWVKAIGGANGYGVSQAMAIDPTGSGHICIAGSFSRTMDFDPGPDVYNLTALSNSDIFISKYDGSGNFIWAKAFGSSLYNGGRSIAIDPSGSGDIYVAGVFEKTVDFDPGSKVFNLISAGESDIFILKLNSGGSLLWAKRIGGTEDDVVSGLTIDPSGNGNIIVSGSFQETVDFDPDAGTHNLFAGNCQQMAPYCGQMFISKLDLDGHFQWAKGIGGAGYSQGNAIVLSPTGNEHLYITGVFGGTIDFDPGEGIYEHTAPGYQGNPSCGDIFVMELDGSGNFIWSKSVSGDFYDYGISLVVDHFNQVHVAGQYYSKTIFFDSLIFNNPDSFSTTSDVFFGKLDAFVLPADTQNVNYPFKIYPNPAREHLTIEFADDKIFPVEISIYNLLGQVVFSEKEENIVNKKTIDILGLAAGIYFVELKFTGKKVLQKVVKV